MRNIHPMQTLGHIQEKAFEIMFDLLARTFSPRDIVYFRKSQKQPPALLVFYLKETIIIIFTLNLLVDNLFRRSEI